MFFNFFKKKKRKYYMIFKKGNIQFYICYVNKHGFGGDPILSDRVLTFNSIEKATKHLEKFKGERNFQIIFKEIING